ncbi:MAG: late competence development ComFB family protein [Catonella sp.]|nr:late competence development ComFB family protein [Catonella sp.]MDY6357446.1 late competence development ComFB family protein [Catonella sp.]
MVDGIQNMAEEAVVSYVNKVWSSNKHCQCDKCKRDVITYALNHVAPRYVDETDAMTLVMGQSTTGMAEVMTAVTNGMEEIGEHPNHK